MSDGPCVGWLLVTETPAAASILSVVKAERRVMGLEPATSVPLSETEASLLVFP